MLHSAEVNIETKHIIAVYAQVDIGSVKIAKILMLVICSAAVLPPAARTNVHRTKSSILQCRDGSCIGLSACTWCHL